MNIFSSKKSGAKFGSSLLAAGLLAFGLSACSDSSSSASAAEENKDPVSSSEESVSSSSVESSSSEVVLNRAQKLIREMGSGINLGNVFEAPNDDFAGFDETQFQSNWGETIKPKDFVALGDSGFKNMRIPVSWEEHVTGAGEECLVQEDWMKQVFWAVDHAIENGMIVVLNTHHWDNMYTDPETETPCLLSVYKQMMEKIKNYSPDSLIVETLNEPRGKLNSNRWNALVPQIIDVVRSADPERVVMVGTHNYNSYGAVSLLELPEGVDNLMVTFHYYDPFNFTHQGATFTDDYYETGTTWTASLAQKRTVKTAFNAMKDWSDAHNVPVYLGEFGAYEEADSTSRETWTTFISELSKSLGFATAYWEFSSGFGVYDENADEWRSYLMRALLHPTISFEDDSYPDLESLKFTLLDDFDQYEVEGSPVNAISGKLAIADGKTADSASGRWYAYHVNTSSMETETGDSIITGDMVNDSTNDYTTTNFEKLVTENGHDGKGLFVKINLKGDSYPWAGFGTNFDGDTRFNFKNLKALTFWAKGEGTFKVAWKSDFAETCCEENWGSFSTEITLTEEWKQYTIWFDQWAASPWSPLEEMGAEWLEHNDDVSHLQFSNGAAYGIEADEVLKIWLDDLRFYGMDGSEFGLK